MFISKKEKDSILAAIKALQLEVFELSLALSVLRPASETKNAKRNWTEEQKAKASERMKKAWADKKNGVTP